MFDIEEKILELDEVAEAEVTKFKIDGEEYSIIRQSDILAIVE